MRALCPVGVTGLTVAQLEERARETGSLYPRELALRLKVRTSVGLSEGLRAWWATGGGRRSTAIYILQKLPPYVQVFRPPVFSLPWLFAGDDVLVYDA